MLKQTQQCELLLNYSFKFLAYSTKDGDTALHYASKYGRLEVVKLLIDKGCNRDLRNNVSFSFFFQSYYLQHIFIIFCNDNIV